MQSLDKCITNAKIINFTMKEILTKRGEIKAIARFLAVSRLTVMNALKGRYNTPLAERIRKIAIQRGGKEID